MAIHSWQPPLYEIHEFHNKRTRYCVAIVIWNEGERFKNQLRKMRCNANFADIIIADRRSSDGSTESNFLKEMGVRTLLVTDEPGLSTGTRMALAYAMEQGYEGVITIDGNGKDGTEALPMFIKKLDDGYDMVQGSRFVKGGFHKNTPLDRYLGIRFVIAPITALGGFWYTDPTNAFRAISTRFLHDERLQPIRSIFVSTNLHQYLVYRAAQLKFKICEIPVVRVYPDDGFIPTKIRSWQAKLFLVHELLCTVMGKYNPKQ